MTSVWKKQSSSNNLWMNMISQPLQLKNQRDILSKSVVKFLSFKQDQASLPNCLPISIMPVTWSNPKVTRHYSRSLDKSQQRHLLTTLKLLLRSLNYATEYWRMLMKAEWLNKKKKMKKSRFTKLKRKCLTITFSTLRKGLTL